MTDSFSESTIACDMNAIAATERSRHIENSRELFSALAGMTELADGYEFSLPGNKNTIVKAAEFVALEKLCCPFLEFSLKVGAENGPITLRLTGREGVKEFIREEISGLLGGAITWT